MIVRQPRDSFRPDIEGLRAVAVLLVVGCHCGFSWCAGGFVGVDVFFVLSGYLITGLLAAEFRTTSRIDLPRFFARRARRLLPACALVVIVTTLAAGALFAPHEIAFTARAAAAAGLYVSNVFFDRTASNYFAPNVEGNPLLHTWSLGVEEQFYLVWPLLILLCFRGRARIQRSIWTLAAISALSLVLSICLTRLAATVAFYELPARAWEFAAGGLLALVPVSKGAVSDRIAVACGITGIVLILGSAVLINGGSGFPGWMALFPVIGTLATLFAGAHAPRRGVSAALSVAPLQFIGTRSYAWYLWHWPFVVFAGILFPGIAAGGKVGAAIAALVIAALTFRFVERPIRENQCLIIRSGLSLGGAAAATLVTIAASWSLMVFARQQQAVDKRFEAIGAAATDFGNLPQTCFSEGRSFEAKVCEFGASSASKTLVLFGDSHAMQWVNAMRTATDQEAWRLITIVRPGCAASDINPHNLSTAADHCKEWRAQAIDKIIALHPSAIVMASYNGATVRGDSITQTLMSAEEIRSGTRRTLEKLAAAGIAVVVLRDTPLPPFDVPACVARRMMRKLRAGESCDFDAAVALNAAAFSAEQSAADGLTNIHFLDLDDLICPGHLCPATQREIIVYRDDNHLTGTFAEALAPTVRARLFQLLRITPAATS
jgi:peptidoglycan/LPS O-acetylase OafA/YrhL